MGTRTGASNSTWKLLIALAIVCGTVAFAAGFLHQRAVAEAVDTQESRSATYAKATLAKAVMGLNLAKPADEATAVRLDKAIEPPARTQVRILALDGTPVYASAGARGFDANGEAVAGAAKGEVSHVIDRNDLVVYAPIPGKRGQVAVAALVSDYAAVRASAAGPLDPARVPLLGLGVVFLVAGLVLMVRGSKKTNSPAVAKEPRSAAPSAPRKSGKGRVSGFEPVGGADGDLAAQASSSAPEPVVEDERTEEAQPSAKDRRRSFGRKKQAAPAVEETAPAAPERVAERDDMAMQREVAIRLALEDQLAQLRTRLQTQEEQSAATIRELQAQLEAGTTNTAAPATVGPAEQDMIDRLRSMEQEVAAARQAAVEATARASSLQQELDAASDAGVSDDAASLQAQLESLRQELEQAQRSATESEQRAQSIESVRSELEVRVAQLGSKAGELEQKAEELEARLREANEGGDAVRTEIATLTAALAAAEARGTDLEASATTLAEAEAEVARLRGELGKQMERAQIAEERVATLEADVAAATHGVEEAAVGPEAREPAGAPEIEATPELEATPEIEATPAGPIASEESVATPTDAPRAAPADPGSNQSTPEPEPEPERELSAAFASAFASTLDEDVPGHSEQEAADDRVREEAEPERLAPEPEATVEAVDPEPDRAEQESMVDRGSAAEPVGAVEDVQTPPAPSDADRYDDVWAAAFPTPEDAPADEPDETPGVEANNEEQERATEPVIDEASSDDEPAEPAADVSVDDDLWALRARLAHAGENEPQRQGPPAPSWE